MAERDFIQTLPVFSTSDSPIRPPAVPLVVRGPYVSTWLPGTILPGTWPVFLTGRRTAMAGIARIDGICYTFAGAPGIAAIGSLSTLPRYATPTAASRLQ